MAPVAKLYGLGLLGAASLTVALSLVALCRESLIKMLKPGSTRTSMPKTGTLRVANSGPLAVRATVVEFRGASTGSGHCAGCSPRCFACSR